MQINNSDQGSAERHWCASESQNQSLRAVINALYASTFFVFFFFFLLQISPVRLALAGHFPLPCGWKAQRTLTALPSRTPRGFRAVTYRNTRELEVSNLCCAIGAWIRLLLLAVMSILWQRHRRHCLSSMAGGIYVYVCVRRKKVLQSNQKF